MESTVLVTGATGYIGKNLISKLIELNREVHILVRPTSQLVSFKKEFPKITIHVYDGTFESLNKVFKKFDIFTVFHLAAACIIEHKPEQIDELIGSNILLGSQLLEAMAINGVCNFINTGTSWQNPEGPIYNPVVLYAATKEAFEAIIKYYVQVFQLKSITLKLFDTYGPNDSRQKILNLLINNSESTSTLMMSPGNQLMDLVYIDDILSAFLKAEEYLLKCDNNFQKSFFVSSGKLISLKELIVKFEEVFQTKVDIQWGGRRYRKREVMIPWNQGEKVPEWAPKVTLTEGLKRILNSR